MIKLQKPERKNTNVRLESTTRKKWYFNYRHGGFDALLPASRSDRGVSRKIDDDLEEQIRYLKHTYPRLSAAAIYRQLKDNGSIRSGQLSEATVCRFINQMMLREKITTNQDMRRYERPHINEVWCGDSSAGPWLRLPDGKKEILLTGNEWNEATFRLEYLLRTKGFGLLTGSAGRGKTTVVRHWIASMNPSLYKAVYTSLSTVTVNDFYRNLAVSVRCPACLP